MAVIITRKNCTLSEANAFYRVEAHNLSMIPLGATLHLSLVTPRYINITPANAGNYGGCGCVVYASSDISPGRGLSASLQEGATCTFTLGTPGVVNYSNHGFAVGTPVLFTSTGTLPTGITANTVYYTRHTECADPANQFWLYTTQAQALAGGSTGRINLSGTPTGTHTCWTDRATEFKTFETIRGGFTSPVSTAYDRFGMYIVNMGNPSSNYQFTTDANRRRLEFKQMGGTTGTLNIWLGADGTNPSYRFYSTTQTSFVDGDTPIFAHYCDIDRNATFYGVLGTGDTVSAIAGVICSNEIDQTPDNVCYLRCVNPSQSYTLNIHGFIMVAGHSGVRFGTPTNPIATNKRLIVNFNSANVGTNRGGIIAVAGGASTNYALSSRSSVFMYGEYPQQIRTTLAQSVILNGNEGKIVTMTIANPCVVTLSGHGYTGGEPVVFTTTGQLPTGGATTIVPGQTYYVKYVNTTTFRLSLTPGGPDISTLGGTQSGTHFIGNKTTIVTTDDMSTKGWSAGDIIFIGKQDTIAQGSMIPSVIESINGTNITLTYVVPVNSRIQGASVVNITPSKYGINLISNTTNVASNINTNNHNNLNYEGCYMKGMFISGPSTTGNRYVDDDANVNLIKNTIKNCVGEINVGSGVYMFGNLRINRLGLEVRNVWGIGTVPVFATNTSYNNIYYKSGLLDIQNCGVLSRTSNYFGVTGNRAYMKNIYCENGPGTSYSFLLNNGPGTLMENIYIRGEGCLSGIGVTGTCLNSVIKNLTVEKSVLGIYFTATAIVNGLKVYNFINQNITANGLAIVDGAFVKCEFIDSIITNKNYTHLNGTLDGTEVIFINSDLVNNKDSVDTTRGTFTRTGYGLPDTTVRTSGVGKYAIRFENTLQGNPLQLSVKIPTGNIQGKTILIGCWVKINSSNYWANNHTMPRLSITYDNGLNTNFVEAKKTTDWQFIYTYATPTTGFGEVVLTYQTDTDATGSDRYVYFDDFCVYYPTGVQYNLGGLDMRSDGYPITPYIANTINVSDFWNFLAVGANISGSFGELIKKIDAGIDKASKLIPYNSDFS